MPAPTPQLTVFAIGWFRAVRRRPDSSEVRRPCCRILTPVLLIGGMTTGIFTPTEGAIAACVWAMVLGLVWYRTLSWPKMFVKVCLDTVETTATVLFIVAAASDFRLDADGHRVTTADHCRTGC